MKTISSLSLGFVLVLSVLSGACGSALNQPAATASNNRDGVRTMSEEQNFPIVATSKVTLIACEIAGNEESLWSIPASSEKNLTREAALAKLNRLYGNAPRLAVQDCNADPNEAVGGVKAIYNGPLASN